MTNLEKLAADSHAPFVVVEIVNLLKGKDSTDVVCILSKLTEAAKQDDDAVYLAALADHGTYCEYCEESKPDTKRIGGVWACDTCATEQMR